MKRFTLLVTVAMTLLSSCGKETNEPILSKQDQKSQESSFEFIMEGENETYLEGEVKALPFYPKAHVKNGKITNISIETTSEPQKVKGIAYFYDPKAEAPRGKGIAKELNFTIEGRRISYKANLGGLQSNPKDPETKIEDGASLIKAGYTHVSFFIGGNFKQIEDTDGKGTKFEYSTGLHTEPKMGLQNLTLQRTTPDLDLRKFDPIFISEGNELQATERDGRKVTGIFTKEQCKFRLFGEFINLRFRSRAVGKDFRFNGILVAGFASSGLHLEKPYNGRNKSAAPKFISKLSTSTAFTKGKGIGGTFYPFTDRKRIIQGLSGSRIDYKAYDMTAPTSASAPTMIKDDPCYTLYLLSEAEPEGGIRFGFSGSSPNIFRESAMYNMRDNVTNLMGKKADSKNFGKFRNLTLELK